MRDFWYLTSAIALPSACQKSDVAFNFSFVLRFFNNFLNKFKCS